MPMEIAFDLSDEDLDHFRSVMRDSRDRISGLDDDTVIKNARELINQIRTSNAPEFVRERVGLMETLIGMIVDPHWAMQSQDRPKILQALAYFAEPDDLIPDEIPGLGFLDDAIMIEIVCRDLKHEIEAYRDFCVDRVAEIHFNGPEGLETERSEWLEDRRRQLHLRMHRRRRMREARGGR